jgi:transglutaminase-like putative cysteine protease
MTETRPVSTTDRGQSGESTAVQRLRVSHVTTYDYTRPVRFGEHRLMIRPRDSHDLRVLDATLSIAPAARVRWIYDVFGNSVAVAGFEDGGDRLRIASDILIDRYPLPDIEFGIERYARTLPFSYPAREIPDLGRTIERHYSDPDRLVTEWTRRLLSHPEVQGDTEAFLRVLTRSIKEEFAYCERQEHGVQTPVETLERGTGSCRDYAVFMMEAVRSVGLATRFVSGYLYDPAVDGATSEVTGAGATHAWVQVYLPGAGWIEFDPTNGGAGGHNLVPVAVAREPAQAVPVSGTFDGPADAFAGMTVEVTVRSLSVLDHVA